MTNSGPNSAKSRMYSWVTRREVRPHGKDFTQEFGQWDQAGEGCGAGRLSPQGPVGQVLDAVHHSHRHLFATDRTAQVVREGGRRLPTDATFAMAVEMILALFGKEFERAAKTVRCAAAQGIQTLT